MICEKCGAELEENMAFCPTCGNKIEKLESLFQVKSYVSKKIIDDAFQKNDFTLIWKLISDNNDTYAKYMYVTFITQVAIKVKDNIMFANAFAKIKKKHEAGDAFSTFLYGKAYMETYAPRAWLLSSSEKYEKGEELVKRAADLGEEYAIGEIGKWHFLGRKAGGKAISTNKQMAYPYLIKAAEKKCIMVYPYLGKILQSDDKTIKKDKALARKYLFASIYFGLSEPDESQKIKILFDNRSARDVLINYDMKKSKKDNVFSAKVIVDLELDDVKKIRNNITQIESIPEYALSFDERLEQLSDKVKKNNFVMTDVIWDKIKKIGGDANKLLNDGFEVSDERERELYASKLLVCCYKVFILDFFRNLKKEIVIQRSNRNFFSFLTVAEREQICTVYSAKFLNDHPDIGWKRSSKKLEQKMGLDDSNIIYIISDQSTFGNGTYGFAYTNKGIYVKNKEEQVKFFRYEELTDKNKYSIKNQSFLMYENEIIGYLSYSHADECAEWLKLLITLMNLTEENATDVYYCPECHRVHNNKYRYCPNCGKDLFILIQNEKSQQGTLNINIVHDEKNKAISQEGKECLEKAQREQEEKERLENVRREQEEKERLENVRREQEEKERLKKVQREQEEKERLEKAQREQEEKERLEKVRREQEEKERLEKAQREQEEMERLGKVRREQEEKERLEKAQREQEEKERLEKAQREQEEKAHLEKVLREQEEKERLGKIQKTQEENNHLEKAIKEQMEREYEKKMKKNPLGIVSLICAVIGIPTTIIIVGIIPDLIGFITGIIALSKKNKKKKAAFVGTVLSVLGIVLFIYLVVTLGL